MTFLWRGVRCRETLRIPATPANVKFAANLRAEVMGAIARGTFDYATFFPQSRKARELAALAPKAAPTVGKLLDQYIDTARRSQALSRSTTESYARWAEARIRPKWGDTRVDALDPALLRLWIVGMVEDGLSPKSARNVVGLLSAVLARAVSDSVIPSNPLGSIRLRSVLPRRVREEPPDPFNDEEIASILAACRWPHTRALFQFAFATGLRTGELIGLRWDDIDTRRGVIVVSGSVVCHQEKDTKTGTTREVPLLPAAQQALDVMRPISSMASEFVFLSPAGRRWRDDAAIREAHWRPTLKLAKVRYRHPYQARHTFASRLLIAGEPELLVAKLLGHATVEMVRRHYGRWIPQPEGIRLRGDYSQEFGAQSGRSTPPSPALPEVKPFRSLKKKPA